MAKPVYTAAQKLYWKKKDEFRQALQKEQRAMEAAHRSATITAPDSPEAKAAWARLQRLVNKCK